MARSIGPVITLRADGRFTARITADGKRISIYGKAEAEVIGKWKALIGNQAKGQAVAVDQRTTVAQYLATWLKESATPHVRPNTLLSYRQSVEILSADAIGRQRLARLQAPEVQAMLNRLTARGAAPGTVTLRLRCLRTALGQAEKWGLVARNVARLVDGPRVPHRDVHPVTVDDARALLAAVKDDRLAALYTTALALGLRRGEACGLRWSDVDLEHGLLNVRAQLQRIGGEYRLTEPKSMRSRRRIPLPSVCIAVLRAHRKVQATAQLFAGPKWVPVEDLVFTSLTGGYINPDTVTHHYQSLLKAAGLPKSRFHDLRHACATLLIAQGVNPRVVMETLGHSSVTLSMDLYAHVAPGSLREGADKMDQALGS